VNYRLAIGAVVLGIVVFFTWANYQTRKKHALFQQTDVEDALEDYLNPHGGYHDLWDLFLAWPINDPYLESIRSRCLAIVTECPPGAPNKDISPEGAERIRQLLQELRTNK
jgi:hypothetical protein